MKKHNIFIILSLLYLYDNNIIYSKTDTTKEKSISKAYNIFKLDPKKPWTREQIDEFFKNLIENVHNKEEIKYLHELKQIIHVHQQHFQLVSKNSINKIFTNSNNEKGEMSLKDAYVYLGLNSEESYTPTEIKKAFQRQALQCHPDKKHNKNYNPNTTMHELNEAKKIVKFAEYFKLVAQGKDNPFVNDPDFDFNKIEIETKDNINEIKEKILHTYAYRSLPQYPIKKEKNWPDIQENYPELLQAAEKHIKQKSWTKRLSYPTNKIKKTECFCNDLYHKFQEALSPDMQSLNHHFNEYNTLIKKNDIILLLTKAIEHTNNSVKQENYKQLKNSIVFHKYTTGIIPDQLEQKCLEIILFDIIPGPQIIKALESEKITIEQYLDFLKNKQNRNIKPEEFNQFDQCLQAYPKIKTNNFKNWESWATYHNLKPIISILERHNLNEDKKAT